MKRFKARRLPSPAALKVMNDAFEDLQKTITASGARDVPSVRLQDVQKACLSIEDSLASRGLLRNTRRLSRLFAGIEHYRRSIDVLCNGTEYLCWVWSPISVVLQIASDCIRAFEIVMKQYTKIGDALSRFQKLQSTFLEDHRFQELLAVFYSDILHFHGLAYKFAQRSGWEVFLLTTCGRFERRFENIIENLERHADLIDKEGNVLNISESQDILRKLLSQQQERLKQIEAEEKQNSVRQHADVLSRLQIDERDQLQIFNTHSECLEYSGTCGWALEQEQVASWLSANGRVQSIWLQGSAGTGKSVLSTNLITFLRANGNSRIIYHFCNDQYSDSKKYDQVLRSMIRQLLQISDEALAHAHNTLLTDRKSPTLPEVEKLATELLGIVSETSPESGLVWIIVDGVDECEADKLPRLVSLLSGRGKSSGRSVISSNKATRPKVLLTSRKNPRFEKGRGRMTVISLSMTDIRQNVYAAIGNYVESRLRSSRISHRLHQLGIGADELEELKSDITGKADGMFLYARLILDYLGSQLFDDKEQVRERVSRLPKTLQAFYSKLLGHIISRMDNDSRERVKSIFRWVAFAKRPLRKIEFLSAMTFTRGNPAVATLVPDFFLEDCANLVEVRHDKTVCFIHRSVKEFLISSDMGFAITETEAIEEQAVATLTCLVSASKHFSPHSHVREPLLRVIQGLYGLTPYSSQYWVDYVLSVNGAQNRQSSSCNRYIAVVDTFAEELERPEWLPTSTDARLDQALELRDARLEWLEGVPRIQNHVRRALACGSQNGLEASLGKGQDKSTTSSARTTSLDPVSRILETYQEAVRQLLDLDSYPGVLAEDFEAFKAEFRNSGFTCRLRSCPRARDGFDNERHLQEHEWSHSAKPRCTFPQCHYPPFSSAKALKSHVEKHHNATPTVRPLRRVTTVQQKWKGSSMGWNAAADQSSGGGVAGYLQGSVSKGIGSQAPQSTASPGPGSCGMGRPPTTPGPDTPQINTPIPESPQVSHPTPDTDSMNHHAQPGGILSKLDLGQIPAHYKKAGDDWACVFNQRIPRLLDIDLVHTLQHQSVVCCVRFSTDGKYIATGCNRSTQIFDVQTGEKICTLLDDSAADLGGDVYIRSVCFSPDGQHLATGGQDKLVRVWDIDKKQIRHRFSGHEEVIYSLDFARDGRTIASGSGTAVHIWDIETGTEILTLTIEDPNTIMSVAISPDTKYLAAGSRDGVVWVWDFRQGYLLEKLQGQEGHKNGVYSVAFSPNSKNIVSGSLDKTIKVWGFNTPHGMQQKGEWGGSVRTFEGHEDFVLSVALKPDNLWVISSSKDRSVRFWDPRTGATQVMLLGHRNSVTSVAPSPTGGYFATSSGDMDARIWSYCHTS